MTVKHRAENRGNITCWLCECDCGNVKVIRGSALKNGTSKSCGCLRQEMMRDKQTKHGMCSTRFYRIWKAMVTRCTNKNDKYYYLYGGKGVFVTERWRDFRNFRDDMLSGYETHSKIHGEDNTSIDRINPDGNYEKENCRWATPTEQVRNRTLSSDHVGVQRSSDGTRWIANIGVNYEHIYLGSFEDIEEAKAARKEAEQKYWGV